ncbi:response regulator [Oceanotoga sp. DSM 15011]|jgi:two-component system chemotaxis response regulator CheY|uniref:Two-component system chemotaxis response regulator CheY n=1 Tax=Oceanotoga teriensis TaxID=515440 RepID=A0AA45C6C3_9BACT|nr:MULTISPECIES: response regulator [Oceanotoga]MDN5343370.1 two-component system, chemotaxis family, chemotaxis protein CheY [Oceanotoga sp.]MDO7975740.1 response regulator [Oceanotoga teriensis]PWJ91281.1 two-component system chemotaxis response regulator CheY [Oceanotoga teriensis]UYO99756.1 response regulator [Oceanotoga sp. DSM 15011]
MPKVLVIDDSPFIYKSILKALKDTEFEVVGHARNGLEGLQKINELNPDLITLDVTMPVMDGIETARRIYSSNISAKVLMLSAMGDDELMNTAKDIGIKHFIQKPFKNEILLKKLRLLMII